MIDHPPDGFIPLLPVHFTEVVADPLTAVADRTILHDDDCRIARLPGLWSFTGKGHEQEEQEGN